MQLEIREALERDRLLYNAIGFAAGCFIAILFFRRVSFMIVAAGPPLMAILLALGTLGWLDFRLNIFLNVMTPLIMVISFADSMQLTFAARDRLIAGEDKYSAFRNAILVVWPACVLTHATAALSFVALLFSSSDLIRTFGQAGIISTLIALVAVLSLLPLLGVLLVRRESAFVAHRCGQSLAFKHRLKSMKSLTAHAESFAEAVRSFRHDHEFLNIDRRVRMSASVHHIHHGHGQHFGVDAANVFKKWQFQRVGGGASRGRLHMAGA